MTFATLVSSPSQNAANNAQESSLEAKLKQMEQKNKKDNSLDVDVTLGGVDNVDLPTKTAVSLG